VREIRSSGASIDKIKRMLGYIATDMESEKEKLVGSLKRNEIWPW